MATVIFWLFGVELCQIQPGRYAASQPDGSVLTPENWQHWFMD
ncbi:hypothetical protein QQ020_18465 [Fulvivirgaceae bacterium BMA12]|uniref:Uncharacterized protein n=1 Tax=Agaribacillus aureus TaxID=3051825 RepID=A0ABT8L9Z2_9BACT|nr:hypothetical protein [Fulvivirgaceae bacterium BMA12]